MLPRTTTTTTRTSASIHLESQYHHLDLYAQQQQQQQKKNMSFEQASATSHWYSFLSQGQVLSRTLAIGVDRLDVFLTISGIVHLPAIALVIVLVLSISPTLSDPTADQFLLTKHHARVMIVVWTQIILSKMVTIAGEAGMVRATGDIYAGRTPEWYPSLCNGLRNMLDLFAATLLVYGAIMAVVGTLTAMVWFAMNHIFSTVGFLFLTFAVLMTCVGIVAVCYIWITTIPLYPIIVMEEKGPINALRRCVELTKGRASYFSVGIVLLWICQFVLGQFLHYIFNGGDTASFVFKPAGILVGFLPGLIYVPLDTIVLYVSVRVDKEGLNQQILQRELKEPAEYSPPVSDYRRVALVDDPHQPIGVAYRTENDMLPY